MAVKRQMPITAIAAFLISLYAHSRIAKSYRYERRCKLSGYSACIDKFRSFAIFVCNPN
jgi:hypothetical protein